MLLALTFTACFIALESYHCDALNVSNLPEELWHRTLTFVDMTDPQSAYFPTLNRRTHQFYRTDYTAIRLLELHVNAIKDINDVIDYDVIWRLSRQIQLSGIASIEKRYHKVCKYVNRLLRGSGQYINYISPKERQLMHALGYRSISIHEYNALTLNDDGINITESGKQKLRLLLLASKASQQFMTAELDKRTINEHARVLHISI